MSFLAPLFLIGAAAVALPIVFHLIRRTSREKTPFSSLMFLLPTPPRVTRRSRLEHILLLLLRCLVLGLLALGFARPFLQQPAAPEPASEGGQRIVVLVDTSASMRREGVWAEAKARAAETLRRASPADQVALLTFDQRPRTLFSLEEWNAAAPGDRGALALKQLDEVSPGWAATRLANALFAAAEIFQDKAATEPKRGTKQIVLISDLQQGSHLEGLQGYEWPRGVEVLVEPIKAKRPTNASLQPTAERDESESTNAPAGPRIRVSNAGDSKREQFQIGWLKAGEKKFGTTPIDVYVPPGQNRVVQLPAPATGSGSERIGLSGDDEEFDNVLFLASHEIEPIQVPFLGDDAENDSTRLRYYLQRALQTMRQQRVELLAFPEARALRREEFAGAQLFFISELVSEARVALVKELLQSGKTVVFPMLNPGAATVIARLLNLGELPAEEASGSYAMFGQIEFTHPLFAPFADPRFSDFTKVHFWKHRRLAADKIPGARVLARFDAGDPALIEVPAGKGSLFILTAGWQPADSQLALSSKFVPLLHALLELSGSIKTQTSQYAVGDEVPLPPAGAAAFTVRKPDGTEIQIARGETKFTQTDQPGIYSVTSAQPAQRFAVNLAAEESKTAPLPFDELERLGVPLKHGPAVATPQAMQRKLLLHAAELEARQKMWRWLIVVALLVLLAESWLAGRIQRLSSTEVTAN
ncbi:MAG: BatA domain-containing protein [Verrucomicrobia bacterium]|nr:BatA domain-containing protein [Verrucomicrobiota bacterium]